MPRPATGKTPVRNLRAPDSEWDPSLERAQDQGGSLTDVIRGFLRAYPELDPGLWEKAMAKAAVEGRTLADVIGPALKRYVATPPHLDRERWQQALQEADDSGVPLADVLKRSSREQ